MPRTKATLGGGISAPSKKVGHTATVQVYDQQVLLYIIDLTIYQRIIAVIKHNSHNYGEVDNS